MAIKSHTLESRGYEESRTAVLTLTHSTSVTRNGLSFQVTWQVMWPPHGHRHTATATRSPPRGLATLGRVTCRVMCRVTCRVMCRVTCRVMWWVMCQVVTAPLTMGTYQGPWPQGTLGGPWPSGTHGHSFPLAHGHSFLVANTLRQPWPMAAFVSRRPLAPWRPRPLAASNLRRPLAHGAPLATIGYQGIVVIRNGRVIKPIVRGGGHGRRGGRGGLGGMSWWCGGIS